MERALGLLQPCRVTGSVFGVHGKKLRREVLLGVFRNDPANPVVFDDDFAIVQVVAQDGNAGLDVFEQFVGHAEPIVQAQVLGADDAHICAGGVAQQIGIGNWGELLLIGMAAIKAALNLMPSEKPVQVFGYLDALVTWLISDHLNPQNEEE